MVWGNALGPDQVTGKTIDQQFESPESIAAEEEAYKKELENLADFANPDLTLSPIKPVYGKPYDAKSLRYPRDMDTSTDWCMFQFYEYKAPFQNRGTTSQTNAPAGSIGSQGVRDYNDEALYSTKATGFKTIALYMPEDVSTGFRAQWGGKSMSNIAANLLQTAGGGTLMDKITNASNAVTDTIANALPIAGAKIIQEAISKTGGDSFSLDDVFGSISGVVLNPNTELLFGAIDMRNFQLSFRLVPRNIKEAQDCNAIIGHFKKAMLPTREPGKVFGNDNNNVGKNYIGFPRLCRVAFMSGSEEHAQLPRFKMCAITQVDVNYTPDGVYSTYIGGQPTAINLSINFQETKIVFGEEVSLSGVGGNIR